MLLMGRGEPQMDRLLWGWAAQNAAPGGDCAWITADMPLGKVQGSKRSKFG